MWWIAAKTAHYLRNLIDCGRNYPNIVETCGQRQLFVALSNGGLGLPDLFERALFHMLKSLEHLNHKQPMVGDFSPELKQQRIAGIWAVFPGRNKSPKAAVTSYR
jgi:hypothetical protein